MILGGASSLVMAQRLSLQEAELQRLSVEVSERLGDIFQDFRGHSPWTAAFK